MRRNLTPMQLLVVAVAASSWSIPFATAFQLQGTMSTRTSSFTTLHSSSSSSLSMAPNRFTTTLNRPSKKSSSHQQKSQQRFLSMHMGHSHSHNHHHNHESENTIKQQPTITIKPTTVRGKILHQISKRGKAISIIFAAAATLLPVLLFRQRRINRTDVVLFAITSTAISLVDKIRSETKYLLDKAKGIRDGLKKHAPPKISAQKYLFQNDNAADRVTLVGVVVNLLLSVGKGVVGLNCHSSALIADAGHSLSDLFSDFITLWAVQIARLPPDDDVRFSFFCVGCIYYDSCICIICIIIIMYLTFFWMSFLFVETASIWSWEI